MWLKVSSCVAQWRVGWHVGSGKGGELVVNASLEAVTIIENNTCGGIIMRIGYITENTGGLIDC